MQAMSVIMILYNLLIGLRFAWGNENMVANPDPENYENLITSRSHWYLQKMTQPILFLCWHKGWLRDVILHNIPGFQGYSFTVLKMLLFLVHDTFPLFVSLQQSQKCKILCSHTWENLCLTVYSLCCSQCEPVSSECVEWTWAPLLGSTFKPCACSAWSREEDRVDIGKCYIIHRGQGFGCSGQR